MGSLLRRIAIVSSFALTSGAPLAQTATAVEYYHAAFDHYFVTALPSEIAALDGGAFGGSWVRTGETFVVWSQATGGASPTCRFFSASFAPKSSHFYTPFAAECTSLKAGADWQYEGDVFYLQLPDAAGGCAPGTTRLYRLYNDGAGGAPNHRYTASRATVDQMKAKGWVSEGGGPDVVFACLPAQSVGATTAAGVWVGTTSANETVRAIVLEDGTYYILYSKPGGSADAGVIQGTASTSSGTLISSNARNFPVDDAEGLGRASSPASLSGTYTPGGTLQLVVTDYHGTRTFMATYVAGSGSPPSLAVAAAVYDGLSGHANGSHTTTAFSLDAAGRLNGGNPNCQFTGSVTPRTSVDAFDWTVQRAGGSCSFGVGPISGVMFYDEATRRIRGFAPFDGRTDQYDLMGTKR
jgi:hypothetical protein